MSAPAVPTAPSNTSRPVQDLCTDAVTYKKARAVLLERQAKILVAYVNCNRTIEALDNGYLQHRQAHFGACNYCGLPSGLHVMSCISQR